MVSKGIGADDANGNVGLTFIRGGALNGGEGAELVSNGIIPLVAIVDDDEYEKDRFGCCCWACLLVLLLDDEKQRSGVCNGGKLRRLPCMKARDELYGCGPVAVVAAVDDGGPRNARLLVFNRDGEE